MARKVTAGGKKEYLMRLERLAAVEIMGWHWELVGIASFWADDDGVPMVAVDKWHPFSNSEQAAMVVKAAEEE
jgi:hypothetical protein